MDVKWLRAGFLFFVFGILSTECVITDVRLVGGPVSNKGTVEIRQDNGVWQTTCGVNLGINDLIVICRQLGFTGASRAITNTPYGQNSAPTIGLQCNGDEVDLSECVLFPSSSCSSAGAVSCHGERYLGCFEDAMNDRVLQGESLVDDPRMTTSRCIQFCHNSTMVIYTYAGVINGHECFCGEADDDYTRHTAGEESDANCHSQCTGDPTDSCGGVGFIAVFSIYPTMTTTTHAVSEVTNESTTSVFLVTNLTSDNVETSSGITTDLLTSTPLQQRRDSCLGVAVGEGIVIILLALTTIALVMYIIRIRKTLRETEQNQNTHGMTLEKKSMSKDEDNGFYQDVEDVKLPSTSSLSPSGDAFYSSKIYEQKPGETINPIDMKSEELRNNADPYIEII